MLRLVDMYIYYGSDSYILYITVYMYVCGNAPFSFVVPSACKLSSHPAVKLNDNLNGIVLGTLPSSLPWRVPEDQLWALKDVLRRSHCLHCRRSTATLADIPHPPHPLSNDLFSVSKQRQATITRLAFRASCEIVLNCRLQKQIQHIGALVAG
jgi:hypothetical protein